MSTYSNNYWDYILPHGSAFCHWGGKRISQRIIAELDLQANDKLCDICCGEGGTLSLIPESEAELYGIDISPLALQHARHNTRNLKTKPIFIEADINNIPLPEKYFSKLFLQDPDIFLDENENECMEEIARIAKPDSVMILQTYCATEQFDVEDKDYTTTILHKLGYKKTQIPQVKQIKQLLTQNKFTIEYYNSLHAEYQFDNTIMNASLQMQKNMLVTKFGKKINAIENLLKWEKQLFEKKAWTGVLFKVRKD